METIYYKKKKINKATSFKQQASSLTTGLGCCRMNLERNNMKEQIKEIQREEEANRYSYNTAYHTRRIADTLEEILQLVKADQEKMEHINLKEKYASLEPDPNEEN